LGSNNLPQSTLPPGDTVLTEKAEAEGRFYTETPVVGQQMIWAFLLNFAQLVDSIKKPLLIGTAFRLKVGLREDWSSLISL
jgi:hypothetical protein